MRDNIDNKELAQYQEIPSLTFLVKEQELKKQLIVYAEELSESLLVASQKYARYEYPENRQVLNERAELAELLNYFNSFLNCERYSQELVKMTKPELHKYISYLCDALKGIGENFSHVIYNSKQPVEYFIKNLDHKVLGEMLMLVWQYTNEYVRKKVINYLEEKMDIIFDVDAQVATGQTILKDNWLSHHLNRELARAEKKKDVIKGALILAHELHHTGDPATALKEEIMASLATMKMLERIIADLKYEPDDINIKAQWQTYNLLGEERFVAALETQAQQGKMFPVFETDQSVLRAYYEQEFGFIKYFLSAADYDSFLLKYITNHPWAYAKYNAGGLVGLVVGIGKGLWNTIVALFELVKMIVMLLVELIKLTGKAVPKIPETIWEMLKFIWKASELLGSEIKQHVTDFDKAIAEDLEFLNDTAAIASAFVDFMKAVPGMIGDIFIALKDYCYEEICKVVGNWAKRSPYDEGFQIGELLGLIVFEVLVAIIGTKGIDKLAKVAKTGKLAALFAKLKLDKVIVAIEKLKVFEQKLIMLLKAKGALSMFKFLEKAEDVAETVKYLKTSKKAVAIIEKFDKLEDATAAVRALQNLGKLEDAVRLLERFDNLEDGYKFLRKLQSAPKDQAEQLIRIFNKIKDPEVFKDSVSIFNKSGSADEFLKNIANTKIDMSVGLDDYIKTGELTEELIAEAFKKYERDCAKDIDKIANLLKSRKGAVRTPEEMAALLKGGAPPPKVVARVGMKRYKSFSHRELAWVNDPAELQGLSNTQLLKRLGWTKDEIDKILAIPVEKRPGIVISLIEDPGKLRVPTWDIIKTETQKMLKADKAFITRLNQNKIDVSKIDSYFDILKRTSLNDYDKLPNEVKIFRQTLEKSFGNNPLFSGKGFTVTPDGNFGLREWFLSEPDVSFDLNTMRTAGFNVREVVLGWE